MTERARVELAQRPPAHHLSGRHAAAGRRRAALQIRRRASLRRDRRAVPAGRAQFRPVLAAPLDPAASPGTVVVEILDPIPPGLDKDAFFKRLQNEIEAGDRAADRGRRASAKR